MKTSTRITLIVLFHLIIILIAFLPTLFVTFAKIQPYQRGFYCDDASIRYPFKKGTVPFFVVGLIGVGVSLVIIAITEVVHSRKFVSQTSKPYHPIPEVVVNIYKYWGIFIFGAAFDQMITNSAKYLIGRLRPHFINACIVDFTKVNCSNYNYVMIDNSFCLHDDPYTLKDMRLSFPSGHSSFSAYCALAISIYLMKRWDRFGPWVLARSIVQAIYVLLAVLCALSRVSDYKHHATDVLTGLISGSLVAIVVWLYLLNIHIKSKVATPTGYQESDHNMDSDGV